MWDIVGEGQNSFYRHNEHPQYCVHVLGSGKHRRFVLHNTDTDKYTYLVSDNPNANVYSAIDHAEEIIDGEVTTP